MSSTSLASEFRDTVNNKINQPFQASYIGQYLVAAGLTEIDEVQKISKQHYIVHGNLRAFNILIDTVVDLPFCEIKEFIAEAPQ